MYESGMTFGNYTIVRKKQNGRYGAIDAKEIERIKCIYLSVGRSESGRAFEREDRLEVIKFGVFYFKIFIGADVCIKP